MRIYYTSIILVALAFGSANAADTDAGKKQNVTFQQMPAGTPINSFAFVGGALVCYTKTPDNNFSCYRIGQHTIGEDFKTNREAWKTIRNKDGSVTSVYPIIANE